MHNMPLKIRLSALINSINYSFDRMHWNVGIHSVLLYIQEHVKTNHFTTANLDEI